MRNKLKGTLHTTTAFQIKKEHCDVYYESSFQ